VIQGPLRGMRRLMRVMRDTASGPQLVAELEVPADCGDVSTFLNTLPSLGQRQRVVARKNSVGHYDNLLHVYDTSDASRPLPNGGTYVAKVA